MSSQHRQDGDSLESIYEKAIKTVMGQGSTSQWQDLLTSNPHMLQELAEKARNAAQSENAHATLIAHVRAMVGKATENATNEAKKQVKQAKQGRCLAAAQSACLVLREQLLLQPLGGPVEQALHDQSRTQSTSRFNQIDRIDRVDRAQQPEPMSLIKARTDQGSRPEASL